MRGFRFSVLRCLDLGFRVEGVRDFRFSVLGCLGLGLRGFRLIGLRVFGFRVSWDYGSGSGGLGYLATFEPRFRGESWHTPVLDRGFGFRV